ncbi:MAG: ABC transporter substrate-binding protein [Phascolarctobacterium sp.]|nr:ABC transporter substrate-binding protein [Phascolarctobacterium sp.]
MNWKKYAALGMCFALLFVSGCGSDKKQENNTKVFATITDATNKTVTFSKQPKRMVPLSASLLPMIDAIGGEIVGRTASKVGTIPESMKNVPEVGLVYNVNTEALVGLKPDLVFAATNQHAKIVSLLESNNIKVLQLNPKTYNDVKNTMQILGTIYNKKDKANEVCNKLDKDIENVKAKLPKEKHRVVIMFATARNVTVQGASSIAGCVSDILGLENIAAKIAKGDKTPYSMEALLEGNPEHIFVTTMGKKEEIENRLKKDFKDNPAWNSLDAVKNNRVHVLPEDLFLLNPGLKYPEAVKYMANLIYPEALKDAK